MMENLKSFTIRRPDDWHLHLRSGDRLKSVLPFSAKQFGRGLIMPNTDQPVINSHLAQKYLEEIQKALIGNSMYKKFVPLMTIYLTDGTSISDIVDAKAAGVVAAKLYPANTTTKSESGVTNIKGLAPIFEAMETEGLTLCLHGETLISKRYGDTTRNGKVGQLRREAVFIKETLQWLVENFPELKIVLEHITTAEAVNFVTRAPKNVAATITAHHLLETLDAALESHHNICMPVLKEERHRQALLDAATSGNPKFFGGTDSAPHPESSKETACGCAGCFTALHAVELYATAFMERDALHYLEDFLSSFGADFYNLERNTDKITIQNKTWTIPSKVPFGDNELLVPFWAGKTLHWKVE